MGSPAVAPRDASDETIFRAPRSRPETEIGSNRPRLTIGVRSCWPSYSTQSIGNLFGPPRSEEHTSELQSHSDLVCRLLFEKKKRDLNASPSTSKTTCSLIGGPAVTLPITEVRRLQCPSSQHIQRCAVPSA